MLRSIKSGQRKMRILALKVVSGELVGLDAKKASINAGVITFEVPFADDDQVIMMADGCTLSAKSKSGVTVSGDGEVLVVGSDTNERY